MALPAFADAGASAVAAASMEALRQCSPRPPQVAQRRLLAYRDQLATLRCLAGPAEPGPLAQEPSLEPQASVRPWLLMQ